MILQKIKDKLIGKSLNPTDSGIFHKISLIAFFAWVGLGADGLSSSCYGPEEAFLALREHPHLSIFVAIATALTIFVISASYSQLIDLFPNGGGGYLVASKLLSPSIGMISGCALLIDYLLTITISVASGTDAIFSFLPLELHAFKLQFAIFGVGLLMFLNIRGVRESIIPLVPIFLTFVITHIFIIIYATATHLSQMPFIFQATHADIKLTNQMLGFWGTVLLILRAYSVGAGTYTGIEAVSNGMPILREPKVRTAKLTMQYMSVSLAFTVVGLMLAYLIYQVQPQPGKTLNAVLFATMAEHHGKAGEVFVFISLVSEALILFIAAQAGFLAGPRVLANMATDRWFPTRFASLSDRLVTQNGVLLMGVLAGLTMVLTKGSVKFLVVLYSINVFITFFFSQLGMVKHWWTGRENTQRWVKRICVNGIGLIMTTFILISMTIIKFHEGGWITLLTTGALVIFAITIKKHYLQTAQTLKRLNNLMAVVNSPERPLANPDHKSDVIPKFDKNAKTAVIMVNGFNGLGLHTLFNVIRFFGKEFRNFIFVEIGVVDAGNFKGKEEVQNLRQQARQDVEKYVTFMTQQGYYAAGESFIGTDVIDELEVVGPELSRRYPGAIFFGGQLVFAQETIFTKLLHNYTVFMMQRKFYSQGVPFVVMPIRVDAV